MWNKGLKKEIVARKKIENERNAVIIQLQKTLQEVKTLRGFLPICANCRKIRQDSGYWQQIEIYVQEHTDAKFTHGLCPDCLHNLYPGLADNILKKIESKEQGIYYFGFKQCPWCRELLPVLNKTLNENNVTAYTVDTKADYFLEKDRLEKIFSDITKEKELTVPFVIFINSNGNIQYNIGTVDNHFADKKRLTNKQSKELTSNLNDLITFSLE